MLKIPEDVEEWKIGDIVNILHEGYDENITLEFKKNINVDSSGIAQTACAFANTHGGIIVIGVDNNRSKTIPMMQRLVGLDDSDDLKSKITNLIKEIKPDILTKYTIFRSSNIKLDHDNKVIVLVKILSSKDHPHQFQYKFYKRTPNGNSPMFVDEIKTRIIESVKNKSILNLARSELGGLKNDFLRFKKSIDENRIDSSLQQSKYLSTNSSNHFLYHQAFLYNNEVSNGIMRIIEITHKLQMLSHESNGFSSLPVNVQKEAFKNIGYEDANDFCKKNLTQFVDVALMIFANLEKILGEFIPTTNYSSILEEYKKKDSSKLH